MSCRNQTRRKVGGHDHLIEWNSQLRRSRFSFAEVPRKRVPRPTRSHLMQAQPSSAEIEHEFAALRDLRRRTSENHTAGNTLDPDLPEQHKRDSALYSSFETLGLADGESNSSNSHEGPSNVHGYANGHTGTIPSDDPFHLFWVPARLHPEIAPTEFRAFLKEHARGPPPGTEADGSASTASTSDSRPGIARAPSSGLSRRPSLLSRQYEPSADPAEDQIVPSVKRSNSRRPIAADLTIADLQRLDQLAEEAATSPDPAKLRGLLRRSMSLGIPPATIDTNLSIQSKEEDDDESNSPIVLPPPGQILRRTARTKIRKPSLPGDGGGHRFHPSKRVRAATSPYISSPDSVPPLPNLTPSLSPRSSSFSHATTVWSDTTSLTSEPETSITSVSGLDIEIRSADGHTEEDISFGDEQDIYDAYVPEVASGSTANKSLPKGSWKGPPIQTQSYDSHYQGGSAMGTPTVTIISPAPVLISSPASSPAGFEVRRGRRSTSPQPTATFSTLLTPSPKTDQSSRRSPSPTSPNGAGKPAKEKEKKTGGLFSKWGSSDKSSKRSKLPALSEAATAAPVVKEKESGFFGALFSKKRIDSIDPGSGSNYNSSRYTPSSPQAGGFSPNAKFADGSDGYCRYPLHVERAIYRLSHIKLANPRRPLYEQVLISNLMFWYLGVINAGNKEKENAAKSADSVKSADLELDASQLQLQQIQLREREAREAEEQQRELEMREREREARERAESEARDKEERERERMERQPSRRNPLTKSKSSGGARRAERPIKAPTYSMQSQVMDQEYGNGADWSAFDSGERQREHRRDRDHHTRPPVMPQYYLPPLVPSDSNGSSGLDMDWLSNTALGSTSTPSLSSDGHSRSPPPASEESYRPRRTISTSGTSSSLQAYPESSPNVPLSPSQSAGQQPVQNGRHSSSKESARSHKAIAPPTRNRLRSNDSTRIANDEVWKR